MTDNRRGFLRRIRARMRLAWLVATAQRFAPYVGMAIVVALALSWLTPFDHGLIAGVALLASFLVLLAVVAVLLPISDWDAARAAERGLGARDIFTTALEFDRDSDSIHQVIQQNADTLAAVSRPSRAIPIHVDRTRLRQLALVGVVALAIGLLPPLGSAPALSSDARAAIDAEADQVEEVAEAVREADVETSEEIVEELERLVEELRQAETLEQALESLESAEKRLGSQIDPQFLSQKAAVQGLARDLALRPLISGTSLDAADQLEDLADTLDALSEPELTALQDRLGDLAASQAAGNPTLSGQLSEASRSIGERNLSAAAQSLRQAAAGQETGLTGARGQQALSETQRAIEGARARLSGSSGESQDGQGSGQGEQGEGEGQGDGQGQGNGQGNGQGQGQGQGQGGAPQTGGGSGAISGVAPGSGDAAGQGGQGTVGPRTGEEFGSEVGTAEVFDPIAEGNVSDILQVGIDGGSGDGALIGAADAPTQAGQSVVPYAQVLPEYLNQAADALGELQLPPSMRGIVQTYFNLLAAEAR